MYLYFGRQVDSVQSMSPFSTGSGSSMISTGRASTGLKEQRSMIIYTSLLLVHVFHFVNIQSEALLDYIHASAFPLR